jgi:hypothetical protein
VRGLRLGTPPTRRPPRCAPRVATRAVAGNGDAVRVGAQLSGVRGSPMEGCPAVLDGGGNGCSGASR